ncbi:MAG: hypothetical protein HC887_00750 [Desulfobacteraceae bacterium]|nr:hypothetical protein [Desulfobacteraceae bacterium]
MDSSASVSSGSLSPGNGGDGGGIAVGKEIVMKTSDTETTLISITKPSDTIRIRNHANINTSANGRGNAGRIGLGVSKLELDSGAFISSVSNAQGKSGDGGIIIVAGAIEEVGKNLYAASESSRKIHLQNNAEISTSSAGTGNAGAILLFASETAMDSNASVSSASLYEQNGGNGGIIQILSEYLKLGNHARITTSSSGQGNAGAIFLLASRVEMDTGASISSLSKSEKDGGKGGGIL